LGNEKKDLTRIEDLGEFIHELDTEDNFQNDEALPDLPISEEESHPNFEMIQEEPEFGGVSEEAFTASSESSKENSIFENTSETQFGAVDFEGPNEDSSFLLSEENSGPQDSQTASWMTDIPTEEKPLFDESNLSLSSPAPKVDVEVEVETENDYVMPLAKEPILFNQEKEYKTPETFEDLKKFSESSSFTGMATEGNPSYSVLIKNVRFVEDVNDIVSLLRELNLLTDSEEQIKNRLMRGMLLVPRISEFSAIFLAHKLRRFDIDIQLGLSDEIHPPKHQETPETGIVSKFNLYQNQNHHFHFDDPKLDISQIIVAATQSLEGHQVLRYMGVASEHKMLDGHIIEDSESVEIPRHYQELANKLKAHALKAHSNAIVGLNYLLTPIPSEFGISGTKYRLTCTGNLVWVNKL
jgi:hypothetical protein